MTGPPPEDWLEHVLKDSDERALLRSGKRYMFNITITEGGEDPVSRQWVSGFLWPKLISRNSANPADS